MIEKERRIVTNQNNDFISTLDGEINNDNNDIISIDDEIDRILGLTHEWKKDDDVVSMTDDDINEMFCLTMRYFIFINSSLYIFWI